MERCEHSEGMDERVCDYCLEQHLKQELSPFDKFVANHWDYLGDTEAEEAYKIYTKNLEKKSRKNYLWLTLSPDKKLRNLLPNNENTNKLADWANSWFNYAMGRWYNGYIWVLEGAVNNDHLHLHSVIDLKSSHNHAEVLKRSWARTFPANQLETSVNIGHKNKKRGEYAYMRFDDPMILADKMQYMRKTMDGDVEGTDLGKSQSGGSLLLTTGSET